MKYSIKSHLSKVCDVCEKQFYASRVTHLYCSRKCSNKAVRIKTLEARHSEELAERVVLHATSAAIPPQNLAYRWLYEKNNVDYFAVPTVTPSKY